MELLILDKINLWTLIHIFTSKSSFHVKVLQKSQTAFLYLFLSKLCRKKVTFAEFEVSEIFKNDECIFWIARKHATQLSLIIHVQFIIDTYTNLQQKSYFIKSKKIC